MKNLFYLCLLLGLITIMTSCGDDPVLISIDDYIAQNNLEVQSLPSGLKYIIDEPGNSEMPTVSDDVFIRYKGYRTDDFVFDSSFNGITLPLSNVIAGWQEGIPLFGKGGSGTLFIPSTLAYGNNPPSPDIPANADLIFDIELLNF